MKHLVWIKFWLEVALSLLVTDFLALICLAESRVFPIFNGIANYIDKVSNLTPSEIGTTIFEKCSLFFAIIFFLVGLFFLIVAAFWYHYKGAQSRTIEGDNNMKYTKNHNNRSWRKRQAKRKATWLKYKNQHNQLMKDHLNSVNKPFKP